MHCTREEFGKVTYWSQTLRSWRRWTHRKSAQKRLNAKEVIFHKEKEFIFPIADGRIKTLGGDQELRTSTLVRHRPIQGESNIHFLGESEGSLPFFDKVSSADPDYDDATLEDILHQAHRAQVDHSVREDLSVSLSSSMSDRTGQPVGDRPGQPGEHKSSEAQIRTLLNKQKEHFLAECQARISRHEFQAAQAEEEQRLLQGLLWPQKLEFREVHQQSLTEMEELRKFQSSTFDSIARRKLIEDQNTKLELSGRVQELQNEVNCMTILRIFRMLNQFAVEMPTLPVDQCHSHHIQYLKGC